MPRYLRRVLDVQTSLYLIAVALCVFCTGLTNRLSGRPLTWFTAFLVIQSGTFLCELLMAHPATPLKSLWLSLLMSGSLLLAPCLWLAFEESVGGVRIRLRDIPRAHAWVIIAGFVLTLPLMSSAHLGTTYANPLRATSWIHSRFIHATMLSCIAIFVAQVPWYLIRCRRILMARLGGRGSHWAELPLAIVLTTWALAIVRTLDCAFIKWPPMFTLVVAVISVGITVGALYLLLRKFAPEEKGSGVSLPAGPAGPVGRAALEPAPAYAKSPLGEAQRQRIRRKLEASLVEGCVYKRGDLTLRALSETLNESPHYVSQVISQDLGTSFYELVNGYRIGEAKRRLRESPGETVLAIAMDVGFNSKSAFHTAFRRCTGITPTEFRQSALN
ncbi:MAG TPA: AraC family transcriptional regulator [Steroidobacteraceae bacterium]|nr:AraC family transcriptional regulator [Steroidobacteraceae bacterium]